MAADEREYCNSATCRLTPLPHVITHSPMKADVFISYAHEDENKALAIADFLNRNGIACWIDQSGLRFGQGFDRKIIEVIRKSCVVLWLASNDSLRSDYVRHEISTAISHGICIGPVFLGPLDKEQIKPPFDLPDARVHGIEYYREPIEQRLSELLNTLGPMVRRRQTLRRVALVVAVTTLLVVAYVALPGVFSGQRPYASATAPLTEKTAITPPETVAIPAAVADLPAGPILQLVANAMPPLPPRSFEKPQLQFEIQAQVRKAKTFAPIADGDSLASEVDDYLIVARPQSTGYLYVFQIDSSGKSQWLFPGNTTTDLSSGSNPVTASEIIQLPPSGKKHVFYLDSMTGTEHIYAVFCATRWEALEKALSLAPPASLAAVVVHQQFGLTRGISATRPTASNTSIDPAFSFDRADDGETITLRLTSQPVEASTSFVVVERWFRHTKAP